jgi:hypothetical protein
LRSDGLSIANGRAAGKNNFEKDFTRQHFLRTVPFIHVNEWDKLNPVGFKLRRRKLAPLAKIISADRPQSGVAKNSRAAG